MKKVFLVLQDRNQDDVLSRLRELGIVHLKKHYASSEKLSLENERLNRAKNAVALILPYKAPKKNKKSEAEPKEEWDQQHERRANPVNAPERPALVDLMLGVDKERKELKAQYDSLYVERNRIADWGSFDPDLIKDLASSGLPVFLYKLSRITVDRIPKDIRFIKLGGENIVYLLALDNKIPGLEPFKLPVESLSKIESKLAGMKARLEELNARLKGFADRRPFLAEDIAAIQSDIEFEKARTGMQAVEGITPEYGLVYLSGFVPAEKLELLKKAAAENGWALAAEDPVPGDNPPTELRNNPAVRIIRPLLSFLGTIPSYWEYDISASYLIFFSLFFAMIFGDASYGLIVLIAALAVGFSSKKKNGKFSDLSKLLLLLSFCTVVWGSITGSWFAIPHEHLPLVLRSLIVQPFDNSGPLVEFPLFFRYIYVLPEEIPEGISKTRWNIQFLCFTVAAIQLIWARGKRIKRLFPSLMAFAQLGWLLMMMGLYFLVLSLLLGVAFPHFAPYLMAAGIFLNLIFSEQNGGNFFINIGKGLSNFFSLFLKSVSCFADIISYIRLFAVGLAGSTISQIFNSMAIPADGFGSFGVKFMFTLFSTVLILIIGHGLNLALTALSVIVHGVRLNLMEYAGNHLEMEWSGYAYNPFAVRQEKK